MNQLILSCLVLSVLASACSSDEPEIEQPVTPPVVENIFRDDTPVTIVGYEGHATDPFISRDDEYLFFGDSDHGPGSKDLHYARKLTDTSFEYGGLLSGANSNTSEGAPSLDSEGNFYFSSLRSYDSDFQALYAGQFRRGQVSQVASVDASLSRKTMSVINFDAEISANGQRLYYATGLFEGNEFPEESNLFVGTRQAGSFVIDATSDIILDSINSDLLEYAPSVSQDELEMFYTRTFIVDQGDELIQDSPELSLTETQVRILTASRSHRTEPFSQPKIIQSIVGEQTESPSISSDGKRLYYHKKVNDQFAIYMVQRN